MRDAVFQQDQPLEPRAAPIAAYLEQLRCMEASTPGAVGLRLTSAPPVRTFTRTTRDAVAMQTSDSPLTHHIHTRRGLAWAFLIASSVGEEPDSMTAP